MRILFCRKLLQSLAGLERAPYPGKLGQRIYEEISQQAWKQWLELQTMLINEHKLLLTDPKARLFLEQEMEHYLFHAHGE